MKIGIMGAMLEEIASLKESLTDVITEEIAGREYHRGNLNGVNVVLVFSRWGKVASSETATTLIVKFAIDQLIFTGIAGALAKHIRIGDIVIGNQLYQHDMDTRPLFKQHELPLTGKVFFEADENLVILAKAVCRSFVQNNITMINKDVREKFAIKEPAVLVGKIASGDLFIGDEAKAKKLISAMPDVLAVEMEGAAVAQVCFEHNIPFVVIRTISDRADHSAKTDYKIFVTVAKVYSHCIITEICSLLTRTEVFT